MQASKLLGAVALCAMALIFGVSASAAEEAKSATTAAPGKVEEITVTSRRVEENIQDIPVALSA